MWTVVGNILVKWTMFASLDCLCDWGGDTALCWMMGIVNGIGMVRLECISSKFRANMEIGNVRRSIGVIKWKENRWIGTSTQGWRWRWWVAERGMGGTNLLSDTPKTACFMSKSAKIIFANAVIAKSNFKKSRFFYFRFFHSSNLALILYDHGISDQMHSLKYAPVQHSPHLKFLPEKVVITCRKDIFNLHIPSQSQEKDSCINS